MALSKPKIKFLEDVKIEDQKIVVDLKDEFTLQDLDRDFYPNDHLLSIFAKKVYPDENREDLPPGWVLLMTGHNKSDNYFGAAFWHRKNRHLVISHKGTQITSLKDLLSDWKGVVRNHYISQIDSACTFAFKVLRELNMLHFSISITGHSLGGWLAQITAFALEYLTVEDQRFRRLKEQETKERKWIHPHMVTLDSPGCYNMLCKMSQDYFHRYDEKKTDLLISNLDITTYVIAGNFVNTTNQHAGILLRLDHEVASRSWLNFFKDFLKDPSTFLDDVHTLHCHNKENFEEALRNNSTCKFIQLNWPIRRMTPSKREYRLYFEYANKENHFKPDKEKLEKINEECIAVPLKEKDYNKKVVDANVFFKSEIMFLHHWEELKASKERTDYIDKFLGDKCLGTFVNFLEPYTLDKGSGNKIEKISSENVNEIINRVKWLFEIFSQDLCDAMRKQISHTALLFEALYQEAMNNYDQNLPNYDISFEDTIGLVNFVQSENQKIMLLKTRNTKDEAFRVRSILTVYENIPFCMLSYRDLEYLDKHLDVVEIFASTSKIDELLIIDTENLEHFGILEKLHAVFAVSKGFKKKIICIAKNLNIQNSQVQIEETEIGLKDLEPTSLEKLINRNIISLSGNEECLNNFSSSDNFEVLSDSIPFDVLKQHFLISKKITKFSHRNDHFKKVFFNLASIKVLKDINIESFKAFLLNNNESLDNLQFIITGVKKNTPLKELEIKYEDQITLHTESDQDKGFKLFTDACLENPNKIIFRLHLINENVLKWIDVFNPNLRIERKLIINGTEVNEEDLLLKTEQLILISNEAGMGKSTVLLHLANNVERGWIFWINLIDAHKYINFKKIEHDEVITFLLKFATDSSELTRILLKFSLAEDASVPVFLFFDGFDEIQNLNDKNKEQRERKVLDILQFLKDKTFAKIFISTRPYECDKLKNRFSKFTPVTPFQLKEVSEDDQIKFYANFWKTSSSLINTNNTRDFSTDANMLLAKFNDRFDEESRSLLGIPLQLRIISEIFLDRLRDFSASAYDFNLYKLYLDFEDRKYYVYYNEKLCYQMIPFHEIMLTDMFKTVHRKLGAMHLFRYFDIQPELENAAKLNSIGMVQVSSDSVSFIHQTFAEFFAAEFLTELIKNSPQEKTVQEEFVFILQNHRSSMIPCFMNDKFMSCRSSNETLKFFPEAFTNYRDRCFHCKKSRRCHVHVCPFAILHSLIRQNNFELMKMLLDSLKCYQMAEPILGQKNVTKEEILNANVELMSTPLHVAVEYDKENIALLLLENGARVNVKNEQGSTCLHMAAEKFSFNFFSLEAFKKVATNEIGETFDEDFWITIFKNQNWDLFVGLFQSLENNDQFLNKYGTIMLYIAAESNQNVSAKKLIDKEVSFTFKNLESESKKKTQSVLKYSRWDLILMVVSMKMQTDSHQNRAKLAKEILDMGDDIWDLALSQVDFKNEKGQTFLHFAVARNELVQASRLIENNANIFTNDENEISPLYLVLEKKNWDFIFSHFDKIMLEPPRIYTTPVFTSALEQERDDIARKIMRRVPPDVFNEIKNTCLAIPAYRQRVTNILEKEKNVNTD